MALAAFRSLYVPFEPDRDGGLPASVGVALALARLASGKATLHALGLRHEAPFSVAPGFVASLTGPANAEEERRLAAARDALAQAMAADGGRHDLLADQLRPADLLQRAALRARLHDLTVIDAPQSSLALGRALSEELLFHTGRPLLVVPATATGLAIRRIVVAWDGTARAARAIHDALPLLVHAGRAELVSVTNEKDLSALAPGTDLAPYLARHGIDVTVTGIEATDGDAGHAIRERAALIDADLIVMGAFAHSRWRQLVLGGVTDSMFRDATVPVFMSH